MEAYDDIGLEQAVSNTHRVPKYLSLLDSDAIKISVTDLDTWTTEDTLRDRQRAYLWNRLHFFHIMRILRLRSFTTLRQTEPTDVGSENPAFDDDHIHHRNHQIDHTISSLVANTRQQNHSLTQGSGLEYYLTWAHTYSSDQRYCL